MLSAADKAAQALNESIIEQFGRPPPPPPGWNPSRENMRTWSGFGPGPFELTDLQKENPWFVHVAKRTWCCGRGYLINWMWEICDTIAGEQKQKQWERENAFRGKKTAWQSHAEHSLPSEEP